MRKLLLSLGAVVVGMFVFAAPSQAGWVGCSYCTSGSCNCRDCSGGGECSYCNILGLNCEPCTGRRYKCAPKTPRDVIESMDATRKLFGEMDSDHEGTISFPELSKWAKAHPRYMTDHTNGQPLQAIFTSMDRNHDGHITMSEVGIQAK